MSGSGLLEDGEEWRRRAEQLQEALDSRVVIEQAKGMLRERFGLPFESAFELLRTAARNGGEKLHVLAAEVAASFATPESIVQALARHPEFMAAPREEQIVQTEELFRDVNDALAENKTKDDQPYVCECANPYCTETMTVTSEDIKVLHSAPGYYLILPGHEVPDFERVVHSTDTYTIVAKEILAQAQ